MTPQPSWKRSNWPVAANGELVSALDGNWSAIEKVVGDKLAKKAEKAARAIFRSASSRRRAIPSAL